MTDTTEARQDPATTKVPMYPEDESAGAQAQHVKQMFVLLIDKLFGAGDKPADIPQAHEEMKEWLASLDDADFAITASATESIVLAGGLLDKIIRWEGRRRGIMLRPDLPTMLADLTRDIMRRAAVAASAVPDSGTQH